MSDFSIVVHRDGVHAGSYEADHGNLRDRLTGIKKTLGFGRKDAEFDTARVANPRTGEQSNVRVTVHHVPSGKTVPGYAHSYIHQGLDVGDIAHFTATGSWPEGAAEREQAVKSGAPADRANHPGRSVGQTRETGFNHMR